MDERIKELMPTPWTFPYPDRELYTKEQFEKFAELVVRECASIADKNQADNMNWNIAEIIREHFGVE